jgi:P27 family predicted phage terminase small subunit
MAGRKQKPTAIKKLEGNPGKRPLNDNEPQPDKTPPACPSWLPHEAKREWRRIVPELERLGLLTIVDRAALTGYCEAWARYVKAAKELKDGFTYEYINEKFQMKRSKKPEVEIARDALNQVKAFCAEFGLTPSSRGRMSVPNKVPDQDPLDKMLGTIQN